MIRLDVKQGSEEWKLARSGIPTSSNFSKILTPTGKASRQAEAYMHRLLAEWLMGEPDVEYSGQYMADGYLMQPEAVAYYELTTGNEVEEVGLCYYDDRRLISCSPDGLVGDTGGVEIKAPTGRVHMATLLAGEMPSEHIPQVQGSIWITGREGWEFLSYHALLPSLLVNVEPDEPYIALQKEAVEEFVSNMLRMREMLLDRGYRPQMQEEMA